MCLTHTDSHYVLFEVKIFFLVFVHSKWNWWAFPIRRLQLGILWISFELRHWFIGTATLEYTLSSFALHTSTSLLPIVIYVMFSKYRAISITKGSQFLVKKNVYNIISLRFYSSRFNGIFDAIPFLSWFSVVPAHCAETTILHIQSTMSTNSVSMHSYFIEFVSPTNSELNCTFILVLHTKTHFGSNVNHWSFWTSNEPCSHTNSLQISNENEDEKKNMMFARIASGIKVYSTFQLMGSKRQWVGFFLSIP